MCGRRVCRGGRSPRLGSGRRVDGHQGQRRESGGETQEEDRGERHAFPASREGNDKGKRQHHPEGNQRPPVGAFAQVDGTETRAHEQEQESAGPVFRRPWPEQRAQDRSRQSQKHRAGDGSPPVVPAAEEQGQEYDPGRGEQQRPHQGRAVNDPEEIQQQQDAGQHQGDAGDDAGSCRIHRLLLEVGGRPRTATELQAIAAGSAGVGPKVMWASARTGAWPARCRGPRPGT